MTIDLKTTEAKIVFWVVALVCGALGGLAADLVKTRKIGGRSVDGAFERLNRPSRQFVDFGTPAGMIVGAVAAAVAVWIFDLVQNVPPASGGGAGTDNYNLVQLVGVCLIAGFAGPKFLQTTADRMLALVDAQHMESALRAVKAANAEGAKQAQAGGRPGVAAAPGAEVAQHAAIVNAIAKDALEQREAPPAGG